MSPHKRYVLANGVGCSRLGNEVVLLDQTGQMLRGVNAEGGRVLSLLNGRRSVEEICTASSAGAETHAFIAELHARGLLMEALDAVAPALPEVPLAQAGAPALLWEQRFVGLQALSDPCSQNPPPGFCQGASRFGDFGGGASGP